MQDLIEKWRREADAIQGSDVVTAYAVGAVGTLRDCAEELAREIHDRTHDAEFVKGCVHCDIEQEVCLAELDVNFP